MLQPLFILNLILFGWFVGVVVNHLANVAALKESLWQPIFCKRRLDDGPEFFSTAHKDETQTEAAPIYCHQPRTIRRWSAVLAYASGARHCPSCNQTVLPRDLAVEVVTPILFVVAAMQFSGVYLAWVLLFTAILVLLTVTDLEHRLIPNVVILPAIILGLLGGFFSPGFSWQQAVFGAAIGFVVFYGLAWLARGNLGAGDVTLATFLGAITGFPNVVLVIVYGIFLAGLAAVVLLLTRKATMKTFFPYGPFLMVVGWVVLIWGPSLWGIIWG